MGLLNERVVLGSRLRISQVSDDIRCDFSLDSATFSVIMTHISFLSPRFITLTLAMFSCLLRSLFLSVSVSYPPSPASLWTAGGGGCFPWG